jgi:large subunit ribosomal protein L19
MSDEQKVETAETPVETQPTEPVAEMAAPAVEETKPEEPAVAVEAKKDDLRPGMTVRVHEKIEDVTPKGEKRTRIQIFEGIILGIRGAGVSRTMTVRKVSDGISVEKIYPMGSPVIAKVEVVKVAKVRRAKLSYLTSKRSGFRRKLKETWNK